MALDDGCDGCFRLLAFDDGCDGRRFRLLAFNDDRCIPCSMPQLNAVHVTILYLDDNCMWACTEGYYWSGDSCKPCSTEACLDRMIMEFCPKGF